MRIVHVAPTPFGASGNRFPAALDDAVRAARWLHEEWMACGGSEPRSGVIGDSSGGTLAAAVGQQLTAERVPIAFQVLIYPMLDALAMSGSYIEFGTGYGFTREKALWYFDQYLPAGLDRRDPRVSPLYEPNLHGLPRTLVITADCASTTPNAYNGAWATEAPRFRKPRRRMTRTRPQIRVNTAGDAAHRWSIRRRDPGRLTRLPVPRGLSTTTVM